ncbi:membrane protein insertion efficiency factor YidD [Helicobacter aurati]|uniref:Putative membrane protein insertion efficiency factor n=1 Tax=Helicobacter aurati TaxID=137778 RepID=A0A3D8J6P5_9HELI|nr:membrane protein insertion efficiency factor YidD [Helicobacter aurati]RDU73153.1 membrane protein insertion efficiency factor YidD [Helicobacter aurati]
MQSLFLFLITMYQRYISPFIPPACRYYPTCSNYALLLIKFDNILCALLKISYRILSCNPLSKGGFAPAFVFLAAKKYKEKQRHQRLLCFQQTHNLSRICPQIPQKLTYFFVESNTHLLLRRFQKFYIISVYLK